MKRIYVCACLGMATFFVFCCHTKAQIDEKVFYKNYKIDPEKKGELSLELDNISFFKDNEYVSPNMNGYTLPGLWIQPKVIYYPLKNIKLELGAHMLKYWGVDKYPTYAFHDIAKWKGNQYQKGFHALPFFRAQIALSSHVNLILGDIYGGANHRLIEPLYNPELNLTADPEAGLQLLYTSRPVDLDAWVSWESFIFEKDTHQESFIFGISARAKLNKPESKFHVYIPFQTTIQHRGGEIDTILTNSVQTWMNTAAGVGVTYNINYGILKKVNFEMMGAFFYQQTGDILPFDKGYGVYPKLTIDVHDFRIRAAYWKNEDFVSLLGSPLFGSISTAVDGKIFEGAGMMYLNAEYSHTFGKGFSMGIDVDVFKQKNMWSKLPGKDFLEESSSLSFSAGVYFRINPFFLIKKF